MQPRVWHQHYDEGVPPSLDYEPLTLGQNLARAAQAWPEEMAVHFLNRHIAYHELSTQVDRMTTALQRLGVGLDDRVAIHLPNIPQAIIAFYAVVACGAQAVMTNPLYVEREIEHQWKDAGCRVAITTDFLYVRLLRGMRERLPVEHFIVASIPELLKFPLNLLASLKLRKLDPPAWAKVPKDERVLRFGKLLETTPAEPVRTDFDWDHLAVLQYTGGTTGVSKAAMLTHKNLMVNVQQCRAWMTTLRESGDVFLAALPYFHIFGLTVCMHLPIFCGAAMVLMPNPRDIPTMIKNLSRHRVTMFPGVPAMFTAINNFPGIADVDLSSVMGIFSGSAPLPVDTLRRFEQLTGGVIFEGFGLTETSPATHLNPLKRVRKPGSVGMALPDTDTRIVDMEDGTRELPRGEEGELVIAGPQVMVGYWNQPDETAHMIRDGWLYTGDLAVMDDDGYVRIVGRKKDMILASGFNIYPDEIDRVLTEHPAVQEACTIGVPDKKRGETVKSFVVLAPGCSVTEEELVTHCRANLARYKVPKLVEFRDELPKSAMLKMLRRELREQEIRRQDAGAAVGSQT